MFIIVDTPSLPFWEITNMDITTSFFWQNVLLLVLLGPYIVGIGISAYYTNRQGHSAGTKAHWPVMESTMGEARPVGRVIAAIGATLLALVFSVTSIVSVIWAFVTLVGLPELVLWALVPIGMIPAIWATVWTAGRAWHVERLLEKGGDTD